MEKNNVEKEMSLVTKLAGSRLRMLRKSRRESLAVVSKTSGVSVPALSNYEKGKRDLTLFALYRLCEYYGITADWLLGRETERK